MSNICEVFLGFGSQNLPEHEVHDLCFDEHRASGMRCQCKSIAVAPQVLNAAQCGGQGWAMEKRQAWAVPSHLATISSA
jgi:hypothetical protein